MIPKNKRKLDNASTPSSKRRKLNEEEDGIDTEMKLNHYLRTSGPPLLCTITLIKNYLSKRKDILFPINDIISVFIGASIDYFCAEIIELARDLSLNSTEPIIRPIHIYYAIYNDSALNATFKQKLIQFMYPILTETCSMFYRFMDKENMNKVNYQQFHEGMKELKIDNNNNTHKSIFDRIDVGNKEFLTIKDWNNYFNESNHNDTMSDEIQLIYRRCSRWFDILNENNLKRKQMWSCNLSELMTKFIIKSSSLIENEVKHRRNVVMHNIWKYIKNETDKSIYHHHDGPIKIEEEYNKTKYILTEHGLYRIIFKYLSYEDIWNGVYQIEGILHEISLSVLNETYSEFVYCRMLNNAIYGACKYIHANTLILAKDSFIITNALLMDMMNKIIKEINIKYAKCREEENEFCFDDIKEILRNAAVSTELINHAFECSISVITAMLNFKYKNKSITEFSKNVFPQ